MVNEETMKTYIKEINMPCIKRKREKLKLDENHHALAIFDVFKGQCTDSVLQILTDNNIDYVLVPVSTD